VFVPYPYGGIISRSNQDYPRVPGEFLQDPCFELDCFLDQHKMTISVFLG
jgi:hypothetical protein